MRALIIKVVLSTEGPYGYSFFCIRRNTAQREEKKYGKLVQWTEELPCFAHECKEQGSVIFFIALRITSLQVHTQHAAL